MFYRSGAAFALSCLCVSGALAQGILYADSPPQSEASFLSGWAEPDGGRIAALRVELAPGWKTYWRQPGEAGIPPTFDWSGSENLDGISIAWPSPIVFDTYGMQTIGYHERMVLPLKVTPRDPARPVRLSLALFYGVCEEICVPARADLDLTIAPGAPEQGAEMIRAALATLPESAQTAGLTAASCAIEGAGEERILTARLKFAEAPTVAPLIVAEGQKGLWFGPLESRLESGEIIASGEVIADPGQWIDRAALRLTLFGEDGGVLVLNGCAGRS